MGIQCSLRAFCSPSFSYPSPKPPTALLSEPNLNDPANQKAMDLISKGKDVYETAILKQAKRHKPSL